MSARAGARDEEPSNGNLAGNNNNNENGNSRDTLKAFALESPFGKSITAFEPIAGCPQGLEGLYSEKNFFFQEIQRDHMEYDLKDETRPTYNIIVNGGKRIYVMVNQAPRFSSKRNFHYDLVGPNGITVMTFEGYFPRVPLLPCARCAGRSTGNKIQAIQFQQVVGEIQPQHIGSQCFTYLNCGSEEIQYKLKYNDALKSFTASTRTPRSSRFDSGIEIIGDRKSKIARISNCRTANLKFVNGQANFALSLSSEYIGMNPTAKAILLACAVLHEIYYMRATSSRVSSTGFVDL